MAFEKIINREYDNITGIVVLKEGRTIYQNYFNECTKANQFHVYSVTKSVISILIGIALDQGYIKNLEQKVLDFFPDYQVKKREKTIWNITLRNLITMTAPFKYKNPPYIKYFKNEDGLKFTLDLLGGKGNIGDFRYTPLIGPDILSGILVNATGQSVLNFAKEKLFTPLGILVEKNLIFQTKEDQMAFNKAKDISGWASDSKGLNRGGWGLTLSPEDMAKIGQLYLNGGVWNGKQIVSKTWVEESTKEHSRWEELNLPYGYLWWVFENSFAAMGDGGNTIYVDKEKNIVVSITSFFKSKAKDTIELIKNYIEPIADNIEQ